MADINFTTGPSTLPDIGEVSYNGCVFSPLFETQVSGNAIKDKALRTVKYMEYSILVDGYVTLPDGALSINNEMTSLRELLTAQAGKLVYRGRGFDLIINVDAKRRDVAWGPIPELLEFQPLGAGRSAKVQWRVKTTITEPATSVSKLGKGGQIPVVLLQFNYDSSVTYAEDGYSTVSMRGTLEVAMTRPDQKTRTLNATADDMRSLIESSTMSGIDLSRFRMTRREFNVSRDKRTLDWNVSAEETPYMDMPPGCTIARGTYSVRPAKTGPGLVLWLCTLRATYTVRADMPRRVAWLAFLALLQLRMGESRNGSVPAMKDGKDDSVWSILRKAITPKISINPLPTGGILDGYRKLISGGDKTLDGWQSLLKGTAILLDFSFDEGIYLDSKTTSFSATWRITTTFSHILLASGLWKKLTEKDAAGNNLWALSMKDVSGARSWLQNKADPLLDVIVDFGGP